MYFIEPYCDHINRLMGKKKLEAEEEFEPEIGFLWSLPATEQFPEKNETD